MKYLLVLLLSASIAFGAEIRPISTGGGGGSGDLVSTNNLSDLTNAPAALTNLGGTTAGVNLFKVANPSAIRYIRINANNTVTLLSVGDLITDLGVPTLSGNNVFTGNNTFGNFGASMTFEGATDDGNETTVSVTDPTADRDIVFPDHSGEVVITPLRENGDIRLDSVLSADGKMTGITMPGIAGAALAFGDLIYLDPTDSRWELVDANSASGADGDARGIIGLCVFAAAADGDPTVILLQGTIRADANFPTFTVNAPIYASETAGDVTNTSPTTEDNVVRVLGFGIDGNSMYFNPSATWITYDAP